MKIMTQANCILDRLREKAALFYEIFFALMVFSKAIGLDSGDRLYYALSAAACAFLLLKLAFTSYRILEIGWMAALTALAVTAYLNSGRMGILLSVLALIGMKDMDLRRLFRLAAVIWAAGFAGTVLLSLTGIRPGPFVVHEKAGREIIRWGLGYSTGNVLHETYFVLAVLLSFPLGNKYTWKTALGLMAGNLMVMVYSLSYTGVLVTTFYLALNLYLVRRKKLSVPEKLLCQLPLPFCVLFSLGAPFLLQLPLIRKLDGMLQARLTFSHYYLVNQPKSLLGARMSPAPYSWVIMDSSYVYLFMTFGVVIFVLFCLGYAALIARHSLGAADTRSGPVLSMIYSFLLYGIMEQFLANAFLNVSLLLFGELLWGELSARDALPGRENAGTGRPGRTIHAARVCSRLPAVLRRSKKGIAAAGWIAGLLGILFYILFLSKPVKIPVPITALPYVDTDCAFITVEGTDGSKQGLRSAMEQYRESLNQPSPMLEFSLPQSVQQSGQYDGFRMRALHLDDSIPEEEYRETLEAALDAGPGEITMTGQDGRLSVLRFTAGPIYEERLTRDAAGDRIEHIEDREQYDVMKQGSILQAEILRRGLFFFLAAGLLGAGAAAVWSVSFSHWKDR